MLGLPLVILLLGCSHQRYGGVVHLTLKRPIQGKVYLELSTPKGYEKIDSAEVSKNGQLTLQATKKEPDLYRINIAGKLYISLPLGQDDIDIIAEDNARDALYVAEGSPGIEALSRARALAVQKHLQDGLIAQQLQNARHSNDSISVQKYLKIHEDNEGKYVNALKQILSANIDGLTRYVILTTYFNLQDHLDLYEDNIALLTSDMPQSWRMSNLEKAYHDIKRLAVGSIAPDFSLPASDGQPRGLQSFRGKYLLIDFWASWCHPCRQENPELVKVYEKYASRGFEIFGVSFDKVRKQWLQAIDEDDLPWPQVSDLLYFDSPIIELYQISGIPVNYLLNPEGKIIAKNIKPDELERMLAEHL